ncbi:MAG TPA: universal stress protein [Bryobacteraceae bacterium]|jgi:nucleotide-binding universal stress UspA family protein|nr:universal stress protein [Bryobacteraceae bacterium]
MFRRILCPTDFSERSRGAAHVARALAHRFLSEIVLLHIAPAGATRARRAEAERKLGEIVTEDLEGCVVSPCIIFGEAADEIVKFSRDHRSDLLLMATHGNSAFRRFQIGSVTTRVLYAADCPVWTSAHLEDWPAVDAIPLRSILCALDFGPRSCGALNWSSRLAQEFEAKLTLAHVVAARGDYFAEDPLLTLRRQQEKLRVPAEVRVLEGRPAAMLSDLAEEIAADLTVIGRTHAASPGLGASAYAIIAHSPCPVLSV